MSVHHLIMLSASVPGIWGYIGRKFFSQELRAPTASGPFLQAHPAEARRMFAPPSADTLSMKQAVDEAMRKASMGRACD
jgi:hypothetical protein